MDQLIAFLDVLICKSAENNINKKNVGKINLWGNISITIVMIVIVIISIIARSLVIP